MPLIVDIFLPRRPVSHQAKNAASRAAWQSYVFGRAMQAWPAKPLLKHPLKFTMVYMVEEPSPGDINNFVKPVQDALCGLIYADDAMILDISAHMRRPRDCHDRSGLPGKLVQAIEHGRPCVYIAISDSIDLARELTWTL